MYDDVLSIEDEAKMHGWLTDSGYDSPEEWMADSDYTLATEDGEYSIDGDPDIPIFKGDWLNEDGYPQDMIGAIFGAMEAEEMALEAEGT